MSPELEKFEILRELTAEEIEQLRDFLEEETFEDGRTLFRRNDEAHELVLILDGCIRLEAGERDLGELGAGASLGELCLARIGKRSCAAYARGSVTLLKLSRESYLRLRIDYPKLALTLQEGVVRSLGDSLLRALQGQT